MSVKIDLDTFTYHTSEADSNDRWDRVVKHDIEFEWRKYYPTWIGYFERLEQITVEMVRVH